MLCYDYSSRNEFYRCIELCIEHCEGFNESGYREIGQSIVTSFNIVDQNSSQVNNNYNRYELVDFFDNVNETELTGN